MKNVMQMLTWVRVHLCVFSCVSAVRRCVWTSSHSTSSCRRRAARLSASAGVLAGGTSSRTPSHSQECDRCAASSCPCWILWENTYKHTHIYIYQRNTFIYCTCSQIDLNLLWFFWPLRANAGDQSTVKTFRGLMEDIRWFWESNFVTVGLC